MSTTSAAREERAAELLAARALLEADLAAELNREWPTPGHGQDASRAPASRWTVAALAAGYFLLLTAVLWLFAGLLDPRLLGHGTVAVAITGAALIAIGHVALYRSDRRVTVVPPRWGSPAPPDT